MNGIGIICSSSALRKWLDEAVVHVAKEDSWVFTRIDQCIQLCTYKTKFSCVTKGDKSSVSVKRDCVWKLLRLLDMLSDQPITAWFTDSFGGSIIIKEAIL